MVRKTATPADVTFLGTEATRAVPFLLPAAFLSSGVIKNAWTSPFGRVARPAISLRSLMSKPKNKCRAEREGISAFRSTISPLSNRPARQ